MHGLIRYRKKFIYKLEYDSFIYLYFYYHEYFWKSFLKKGLKLRAINFFSLVKYELKLKEKNDPYIIFLIAMLNISPQISPKKVWVAGASRTLAFPILLKRQVFLGVRWLLEYCKENKKLNFNKLINIIIESLYNKGELWKKKKDLYEVCIENRLFFRYIR